MGDLLDEDLEFRGGTLQLSSENATAEPRITQPAKSNTNTSNTQVNPSVLSGADSLTSSSSSFADARTESQTNAQQETDPVQTVYPRYDVPFNSENIKDFFTFRKGVVENAIQECITGLLFPEDGEYLGSWLLTEITLWDNEKERIVLLTSRLVMTIKYDFIAMKQLDFKKTYLDDLDTIVIGELVYPPSSLVPRLNGIATGVTTVVKDCVIDRLCRRPSSTDETKLERNLRGVRLMWNKGEPLPMKTVWNPFSQDVPFLTFASHPIYWHKDGGIEERSTFDMELFAQKLQRAVENMTSPCCIHHSPIVIQSYVGLTSLLHNKTSMGFFKVRGKFSF
ncbi:tumor protein p63-regulated gene 1-like protein isoform X2 [Vanessa cardui]|uniref:tumor protein p63-regulated gene 1-like protein isoform X2 n=1 Tax=Vanessa cardui TaxID=171605 RepID=UPI001F147865|nr:tumor protein p63-regulated gene 1-like protein isoform X2 [Vanessa cardui]